MEKKTEKILILGGTFNPIHNGHVSLMLNTKKELSIEKGVLIPSYSPPHKTDGGLISCDHRFNMCRLAAEENGFFVSDIEILRKEKSYTIDTLNELKNQKPDTEIFFLCGADMFLTLLKWYDYENLKKLAVFCTAPRGENSYETVLKHKETIENSGGQAVVFDFPVLDISSTMIRKKIQNGEDVSEFVPRNVEKYIYENKLYNVFRKV